MLDQIAAFAQTRAKAAARRAAMSAASLLVAGVLGLAAVAGPFAALFFWVEQEFGPIVAGLICAGAAITLRAHPNAAHVQAPSAAASHPDDRRFCYTGGENGQA